MLPIRLHREGRFLIPWLYRVVEWIIRFVINKAVEHIRARRATGSAPTPFVILRRRPGQFASQFRVVITRQLKVNPVGIYLHFERCRQ